MQPRRPLVATAAAAILMTVVGLIGPATAQATPTPPTGGSGTNGFGNASPTGIDTGVSVPGGAPAPGTGGGGSGGGGGGSGGSSPCQWTYLGSQSNGNVIDAQGNVLPGDPGLYSGGTVLVPPTANGTWYLESCPGQDPTPIFVPAGSGGAPPPPPSPVEAAQLTPFPTEVIHHNPCYLGLTGLTSWLWTTVDGGPVPPVTASATVRGYTVKVTAHPIAYYWTFGDGDHATSIQSGTEQNPSVTYLYETKGTYDLTLTVQWAGTYTFSGHGIDQSQPVGPVNQTTQHLTWRVQEIRSVLIAPGATDPPQPPLDVPSGC